ncbi:MAG: radical SAM protein [Candidatus Melainabacteria bacterium]|nr:radical SAM protein [Candidatus Melainabacteria bacterium]
MRTKAIDPASYGNEVRSRVYNATNNERLVRRIRQTPNFGGSTTIDIVGCNFFCSYCFVDGSYLTGNGGMLEKDKQKGTTKYWTPEDLVKETIRLIEEEGFPNIIEINSAEPFLTPKWMLDVVEGLAPYLKKTGGKLWIDTNGAPLVANPRHIRELEPFKDTVSLYISSKHTPQHFQAMTRVGKQFADVPFKCLEMLWDHKIPAALQGPMADLFFPDTFDWYTERLDNIHEAAPILMEVQGMQYNPIQKIKLQLSSEDLWDQRMSGKKIQREWQDHMSAHYGKEVAALINLCNRADQTLVNDLVFKGKPVTSCHLFAV